MRALLADSVEADLEDGDGIAVAVVEVGPEVVARRTTAHVHGSPIAQQVGSSAVLSMQNGMRRITRAGLCGENIYKNGHQLFVSLVVHTTSCSYL